MGGQGSGRKPDPIKRILEPRTPIMRSGDSGLFLPNLSGVKKELSSNHSSITTDDITEGSTNLYWDYDADSQEIVDIEKLNFTSTFGAPSGVPNKINLFGDAYGFGIAAGELSYLATSGAATGHKFYDGETALLTVGSSGINAHSKKINNVTDPTSNQDAATKKYVDDNAGAGSLNDLSDVTLTSPTTNSLLYYNGSAWIDLDEPGPLIAYRLVRNAAGNLTWVSDVAIINDWATILGSGGRTSSGNNPQLTTTDKLEFRDADIYINSPTDGDMRIQADDNIHISGASVTIPNFPAFCVVAEESANPSTSTSSGYQWSFGNGALGSGNGPVLPYACTLKKLSLRVGGAAPNVTVEAYKNGASTGATVSVTSGNTNYSSVSVSFAAGDQINFRTTAASGTLGAPNVVAAWFEMT